MTCEDCRYPMRTTESVGCYVSVCVNPKCSQYDFVAKDNGGEKKPINKSKKK